MHSEFFPSSMAFARFHGARLPLYGIGITGQQGSLYATDRQFAPVLGCRTPLGCIYRFQFRARLESSIALTVCRRASSQGFLPTMAASYTGRSVAPVAGLPPASETRLTGHAEVARIRSWTTPTIFLSLWTCYHTTGSRVGRQDEKRRVKFPHDFLRPSRNSGEYWWRRGKIEPGLSGSRGPVSEQFS